MAVKNLRENFIAGLLILAPLILTVLILKVVFGWTLIIVDPIVAGTRLANYTQNIEILAQILALTVVTIGFIFVGRLSQNRYGEKIIHRIGSLTRFIPLFRNIYFTVRQVSKALTDQETHFKKAVSVEYPRKEVYRIGFITSKAPQEMQDEEKMYNVFLPNSPNPTGGALIQVKENEINELDMSVKAALKTLMTSGMASKKED